MKKFAKIVGILLCLALVLSILPASIIGATGTDTAKKTVMQKIDLSGCVIGTCSSPYNASVSYKDQVWYSTKNPTWKNLEKFVDGDYTNDITYSVSDDERGDFYADLTKKYSNGTSADQLKLHYGLGGNSTSMPTVTIILELTDGTEVEKSFTTNWSGMNAADPLVWNFGETYDIKGVYVWSPDAPKVSFAEFELYGEAESSDVTEPEEDDVFADLEELDAPVPVVGYYSNNNTDGDITNHSHATHSPANMVDGDVTNQSRSGYFTHAEIADGTKIPVILFTFEDAATVGGIEIFGYQAKRYNMEDFDIQVNVGGNWTTVATVEDAFRDQGDFGDDLTESLKIAFDDTYVADALRILVKGISDMTADAEDDADSAELLTGGYIRIREIKLYGLETVGEYLENAKLNGVDIGEYVIVYSDAEPDYNVTAAEYIQAQILKKTGRTVNIVEDDAAETANEILVGHTNRSLSATVTAPENLEMKFNLQANGTKIAMEADYFIIAGAAYYFVETYVDSQDFESTVPSELQTLAPITKKANNYIILIGDGMGVMQTKLFDKYGASPTTGTYGYGDGEDVFYGYYLPYQGFSKTANVFGTVTDSAAGGTALATGYKTVNGYVGKDKNLRDIKNMSELAWEMGKAVGIMSTEGSDGATPASFSAHAGGRYDDEIITDQDAMEALGYVFVERYRSAADAGNAVFKTFTAEEYARWDAKVRSGMSKLTQNPNGFFLVYEEAYIDKNCHNNDIENAYRTVYRFNQQIAYFMEFAMYNPDTFVLITADHETAGLDENWNATAFNAPPETGCDHSLQDVPVFVYGEGGEIFDGVTAENASIGRTFADIMTDGNADDFGNPLYPIIGEEAGEDNTAPDGDIPEAPTTPVVQGTVLKVVSPTLLTTKFGVYPGGDLNATFSDGNDGYCVTDGWYIRSGYSEHNKADGLTALLIDINGTIKLGGLEMTGHTSAGNDPTNFEVQAYVNGEWVTVYTVTSHPFASGTRTVKYTFDVVETSKVRILIHDYQGDGKCYIGEVTLFESTTGNVSNKVNLVGTAGVLTDGDKSTTYTGEGEVINLMVDGQPTAISGFALYHARANNTAFPATVTISIQMTPDGGFTTIGVFETNWSNTYPLDSVFVEFGQTYMAYAINVAFNTRSAAVELELFQNVHEGDPTDPEVPTDPTEPEVPTDPTEPEVPTDPTEPEVPTDPTDPELPEAPDYTWIDLIPESSLTPHVGYFAGGDFTTLTDENPGEAAYLTDAKVSTGSWVHGATFPIPSGKVPGAILELNGTKIVAGVELSAKPGQTITAFDIAVLGADGNWYTVYTTTNNTDTDIKVIFETPVLGTKVRLIINAYEGNHPMLQEMWVYEGRTDDALVQIPVTNVTANQTPVVPEQGIENIVDGDHFSYYQIGAANMPVVINFDTTNADGTATNVSRMRIFAFNNEKQAAKEIIVQVRTGDETWETVYTGVAYELGHTDTFTLDFGATYAAYDVRLTINTVTGENLVLTEVDLFGAGKTVTPPTEPEDPTDPTDPEVTDPTDPEVTNPTEPEDPTDPETTDPTDPVVPTDPTEPEDTDPTEPEATDPADPDAPDKTGDVTLSVLAVMMAISVIGGAVVVSKKKNF